MLTIAEEFGRLFDSPCGRCSKATGDELNVPFVRLAACVSGILGIGKIVRPYMPPTTGLCDQNQSRKQKNKYYSGKLKANCVCRNFSYFFIALSCINYILRFPDSPPLNPATYEVTGTSAGVLPLPHSLSLRHRKRNSGPSGWMTIASLEPRQKVVFV